MADIQRQLQAAFDCLNCSATVSISQVERGLYEINVHARMGRFRYFACRDMSMAAHWVLSVERYGERNVSTAQKLEVAVVHAFINEITRRMYEAALPCEVVG